jgi:hypothetical protein
MGQVLTFCYITGSIARIIKIERYRNVREEGEETEMIQERRLKKKLFRTLGPGEDELYSHRNTVRLTNVVLKNGVICTFCVKGTVRPD